MPRPRALPPSRVARPYPTLLVIGRDGRIRWSDKQISKEEGLKRLERVAKALSIPWPLDEKGSEEKLVEQSCRIQEALFSEAIDAALAKP